MAFIPLLSMPLLLIVAFIATLVSSRTISNPSEFLLQSLPQSYDQVREFGAQECIASFVNTGECIVELTRVFRRAPLGNIAWTCCNKFRDINNNCWPMIFPNLLLFQGLKDYWAGISGLENGNVGSVPGSIPGSVPGLVASPAPAPAEVWN